MFEKVCVKMCYVLNVETQLLWETLKKSDYVRVQISWIVDGLLKDRLF